MFFLHIFRVNCGETGTLTTAVTLPAVEGQATAPAEACPGGVGPTAGTATERTCGSTPSKTRTGPLLPRTRRTGETLTATTSARRTVRRGPLPLRDTAGLRIRTTTGCRTRPTRAAGAMAVTGATRSTIRTAAAVISKV